MVVLISWDCQKSEINNSVTLEVQKAHDVDSLSLCQYGISIRWKLLQTFKGNVCVCVCVYIYKYKWDGIDR
jgi:hypothetical protein